MLNDKELMDVNDLHALYNLVKLWCFQSGCFYFSLVNVYQNLAPEGSGFFVVVHSADRMQGELLASLDYIQSKWKDAIKGEFAFIHCRWQDWGAFA